MNSEREKTDNTRSIGVKTNLVIGGGILAAALLYSGVFEGKKHSGREGENSSYTTPLFLTENPTDQADFEVVKCSWNDADRNYLPLSLGEVLAQETTLLPDCVLWEDGEYRPILVQKSSLFFGKGYMGPAGEDFKE